MSTTTTGARTGDALDNATPGLTGAETAMPLYYQPGTYLRFSQNLMDGNSGGLEYRMTISGRIATVSIRRTDVDDAPAHYWDVDLAGWFSQFIEERMAEGLPTDGSTELHMTRIEAPQPSPEATS